MMWFYRLLLRCYPAGFRASYGEEMCAVFAEKRARARGGLAVFALWIEATADVVRHAIPLHLDALRQDLRFTRRSLIRVPGFALTVIAVSALGIGANTAVFTVVDRVLVRSLPFRDADRLVRIWEHPPGYGRMEVAPPNYRDWRELTTVFSAMAAYTRASANLVGDGPPERLEGANVTGDLLPVLGVAPLLGRGITAEDDNPATGEKVVLSYGLWQRAFGADSAVVGRTVVLDDVPHVVTAVMPREFLFPDRRIEYWTPLRFSGGANQDRNNNYLEVVGRLRNGVTVAQARAEMQQVMAQLEQAYPEALERTGATVNRLRDEVPSQTRLLLLALMGASLCVLLIACLNLANLLMARAAARRQELAVRSSLGAGRRRLIRQLLTESVVLAFLGGAAGVGLAYVALPLLERLVPASVPVASTMSIDPRVMGFALLVTVVTGLGFGAFPAMRAGRSAVMQGLRQDARAGGGRADRVRSALVIGEVAASVVLLIASGLLIRALQEVRATDPGFQPAGVLTARTWLPWPRYAATADWVAFYDRVLDEVRALPGVNSAAYTSFLPMVMRGGIWPVELGGDSPSRAGDNTASLRFVTPGYPAALGIQIRVGREIRESDTQEALPVAVVSQSFVDRYWPGQNPIGRTFGFAFMERTVVGVVDDISVRGLEDRSEPQVYLSYRQVPDGWLSFYAPKDLAIRVSGDPLQVTPAVREIVRRIDPTQPVTAVQTLEDIVRADSASRGVQLQVLGVFAGLAFLLAAVGLHGLLSFTATYRTREIGVRMALGASRRSIARMFLSEGAVLGVTGVVLGGGLGYAAGRAMESLLFGVPALDPVTFAAVVVLALVMTVLGTLPPALRAASVDPNLVMRE